MKQNNSDDSIISNKIICPMRISSPSMLQTNFSTSISRALSHQGERRIYMYKILND